MFVFTGILGLSKVTQNVGDAQVPLKPSGSWSLNVRQALPFHTMVTGGLFGGAVSARQNEGPPQLMELYARGLGKICHVRPFHFSISARSGCLGLG
jgi:hypothetical protein